MYTKALEATNAGEWKKAPADYENACASRLYENDVLQTCAAWRNRESEKRTTTISKASKVVWKLKIASDEMLQYKWDLVTEIKLWRKIVVMVVIQA